jgi:hypothetical protein
MVIRICGVEKHGTLCVCMGECYIYIFLMVIRICGLEKHGKVRVCMGEFYIFVYDI